MGGFRHYIKKIDIIRGKYQNESIFQIPGQKWNKTSGAEPEKMAQKQDIF